MPKDSRPRSGDQRPATSKPRWSKDATGRSGAAQPSGDRTRHPRPYEADRPKDANPARKERPNWEPRDSAARPFRPAPRNGAARGERPDWTPRGYDAAGGDRRKRPEAEPRKPWTPREDRPARDFGGDRAPRDFGQDRPQRDRPWESRPARQDRPAADRPQRAWQDRPQREERPRWEDRPQREAGFGDREARPFTPVEDVVLERLDAQTVAADAGEGLTFGDLGLGDNLVRQLAAMGAAQPFPIQAATIPEVIAGRDVLGRGRTGSGKTIAFAAPVVERLLQLQLSRGGKGRSMGRLPRAIILAPTRELAQQIDRTVQPLARSVGLFTISIVGGVPYQRQLTGLQRGADIVIGTPGRIQDLINKGELDLSDIVVSVLDEADHMCDLGFLEPVQDILRLTPEGSQRLLFSATLDRAVEQLVGEFLDDPSVHEVEGEDQASSTITHRVYVIDASAKRDIVTELAGSVGRSIVFARTRAFAEELSLVLDDAGIPAASLHGDLNQSRRNRSLQALTRGEVRSLVATDVAARGIHVDDVDLVIQADMPDDHKTYMHRAGRTGRAGALGTVITVIPPGRRRRMEDLLRNAGIEAEWEDRATTKPRGDRPARTFREDRPYQPREQREFRAPRESQPAAPRMSDAEFAEFQAWKASKGQDASSPE